MPEAVNLIESARQDGEEVTIDLFPYTKTGSLLYMLLPPWLIEGGKEKITSSLRDTKLRKEAIDYLKGLTLHFEKIVVASTLNDATSVGKSIAELAASSGMDGEEIILELVEVNQLHVSIFNDVISEEHIKDMILKDYAMIASDGVGYDLKPNMPFDLAHPRSYGAFPSALESFTRKNKILPWQDILYKFTEMPAKVLGLKDRGKLESGAFADIVVFDPEKIGSTTDYTSIRHEVQGIDCVLLNGKTAMKNGVLTGEFAGKIIKRA
jgi:N-acyl-D-amino-acid deacylase